MNKEALNAKLAGINRDISQLGVIHNSLQKQLQQTAERILRKDGERDAVTSLLKEETESVRREDFGLETSKIKTESVNIADSSKIIPKNIEKA